MVRSCNATSFSMGSGGLRLMILSAILFSSRYTLVVASIMDTANQSSFHWFRGMPAVVVTSEDYLLASTMPTLYGLNWPTAAQIEGRNAEHLNEDGALPHSGHPNGEIEREAIWARADDTERVLGMQFEKEFAQIFPVMYGTSRKAGLDDLSRVGYVSNSKPLYTYAVNTELSIGTLQ